MQYVKVSGKTPDNRNYTDYLLFEDDCPQDIITYCAADCAYEWALTLYRKEEVPYSTLEYIGGTLERFSWGYISKDEFESSI